MPVAPSKPCRFPGCAALGTAGGYCDAHKSHVWRGVQEQSANKPELVLARRIGDSAAWRKARQWFSATHPLCCDPFTMHVHDGKTEPVLGTQVHHVEPLRRRPELACVASNLRRLCDYCHARIELAERNGTDTRPLFVSCGNETANDAVAAFGVG